MTLVKEFYIKERSVINCDDYDYMNYYINLYNGKAHIYEGLYCFKDVIERNNAIVDKVFLDFDNKEVNFLSDARIISKYLYQKDIRFCIRFSGRGFHIYISLNDAELSNPGLAMKNYVRKLHETNNTTSDLAVVGDLRRLRRVLHTINVKSHLYCIPISYKDLHNKTYEEIQEYAKLDRGKDDIYYGKELLDISEFDGYDEQHLNVEFNFGMKRFDTFDFNFEYKPPCICEFLSNPDLGYSERRDLIIFLRDMGYNVDEVTNILEEHLSPEKFNHSVFEEKQVTRLFNKDMLIMRSCFTLKALGLCPSSKCSGNNLYI